MEAIEIAVETLKSIRDHSSDNASVKAAQEALKLIKEVSNA
jgi:hypothetical protein